MSYDSLLGREVGSRSPGYKERVWYVGSIKWAEYSFSINIGSCCFLSCDIPDIGGEHEFTTQDSCAHINWLS